MSAHGSLGSGDKVCCSTTSWKASDPEGLAGGWRGIPGAGSGTQEPNSRIMQIIMKIFHRAMKMRK